MMSNALLIGTFLAGLMAVAGATSQAQITPEQAGYVDVTAPPFSADPAGEKDSTDALQRAFDEGVKQVRPVFLPAGTYKVSSQIRVDKAPHDTREENALTVKGPGSGGGRAILRLAASSFTDPAKPEPVIGLYYDKVSPGDRLCVVFDSVDIQIEPDNAGAAGLAWGGAEAAAVWDVHISGVDSYRGFKYGFWTTPGSGGSMAMTSVDGGDYGYFLDDFGGMEGGSRETASMTHITSTGARLGAMYLNHDWACAVTGGRFVLEPGVPAITRAPRGNGHPWTISGVPVLIDTSIEWTALDPKNLLLAFGDGPLPFYLENVYLNNAAAVLDRQTIIPAGGAGWSHIRQLAFDSANRGAVLGFEIQTPIYLDGVRQADPVYRIDGASGEPPPADLQSRHGWGKTFPDFLSPGAVLLTDYANLKQGDDWQPVFQHLIDEAKAPVIIVPKGQYTVRSTIQMGPETAIVGTIQWFTQLWGVDDDKRFGGSTDAPNDATPIISSPKDPSARPILADLRVLYSANKPAPRPLAVFPVLWQSGPESILRNVYAQSESDGGFWIHQAVEVLAEDEPRGIRLRVTPSPLTVGPLAFAADSHTKYHDGVTIPDQLILQTVGGITRLTAPSVWPFADDHPQKHAFDRANLTITPAAGGTMDVQRLVLHNPSVLKSRGGQVLIRALDASGSELAKHTADLAGKSRTDAVPVELNWTGVSRLELTSEHQFDLSQVKATGATVQFDGIEGTKPEFDKHYDSWNPGGIWRDMPSSPQYFSNFVITGGVKFYNHAVHGGQAELNYRTPHTLIESNTAPVRIYHFHAQHGDNDGYLHLRNASDVRVYGMKTETSTSFVRAYESKNLRFYGMGGATNPVTGHTYFFFEDCDDFRAACVFDVVYNKKEMIWGGAGRPFGNAHQNASNRYDGFNVVEELRNGMLIAPAENARPTLYQRQ